VRGQVSHVPADRIDAPRVVVLRGGFALPPVDGVCVVGASYDLDDEDAAVRESSHAGNLARLQQILPFEKEVSSENLQGRVGFRVVAPDRLPLVGRLAENLYGVLALGSRGLVWAPLAAELLACELEGEPLPLEAELASRLGPARFAARFNARAGSTASPRARR
jgi:tRNA 5-methylaminomethyl-2-thiouridine biosynthesis bifunctional protein